MTYQRNLDDCKAVPARAHLARRRRDERRRLGRPLFRPRGAGRQAARELDPDAAREGLVPLFPALRTDRALFRPDLAAARFRRDDVTGGRSCSGGPKRSKGGRPSEVLVEAAMKKKAEEPGAASPLAGASLFGITQ